MWTSGGEGSGEHESDEILETVKQAHVVEWGGLPGSEPRKYQITALVTEDPTVGPIWKVQRKPRAKKDGPQPYTVRLVQPLPNGIL